MTDLEKSIAKATEIRDHGPMTEFEELIIAALEEIRRTSLKPNVGLTVKFRLARSKDWLAAVVAKVTGGTTVNLRVWPDDGKPYLAVSVPQRAGEFGWQPVGAGVGGGSC